MRSALRAVPGQGQARGHGVQAMIFYLPMCVNAYVDLTAPPATLLTNLYNVKQGDSIVPESRIGLIRPNLDSDITSFLAG